MKNLFADLETRSPVPIKHGTHHYAEEAEVLLWSYALDDGPIDVWDAFNDPEMPIDLAVEIDDPDTLVWFHNSQFDFVVLEHAMPETAARIPQSRRRDTMVQAYCHGLPGKLDTLGEVLNIDQDKRKLKTGKALMRFFCIPQKNDDGTTYWNTRETHPVRWREFMEYAGGDIAAMREVHRKVPKWNYRTGHPEMALWHLDIKINNRGAAVDIPLAHAAVRAAKASLKELADETVEATDGVVGSATQRDVLLKYILESHGVALPDMRADTLERRMRDENLPPQVRTLLAIRLQASMNSASKYTALLNGVSHDGRLRGLAQFCGASRTGRWAHRMFQPGNLMRPPIEVIAEWHRIEKHEVKDHHIESFIRIGIEAMLAESEALIFGNVRALAGAAVRGAIIAPPGRKLVIADLANIEGRVAAWLAGEEWKLQAFRDYDTIIGTDDKGKAIRLGADLYKLAYAKSFNVSVDGVDKEMRQIGKVEELMFQYQGGVGAWITGAATYGIDLAAMTEAVWDVLADDVKEEAHNFLMRLYSPIEALFADGKVTADQREARRLKARYGLPEKTFIACDAIKRLWRRQHPQIESYWELIENTVIAAIQSPGATLGCRKLKIRRDGSWLRIALPSGRALCYPFPVVKNDKISFTGMSQYTHSWTSIGTYGGKLFENCIAEGTEVLTSDGWVPIQQVRAESRVWDGFEWVSHGGCVYRGKQFTMSTYGVEMTPDHRVLTAKGWRNASSCEGLDRAYCWVPDSYEIPWQRWTQVSVGDTLRLREDDRSSRVGTGKAESPGRHSFMRVHEESHDGGQTNITRHVVSPRVLGMAFNVGAVREPEEQSMAQLRRAWDQGVCSVARFVRGVLGRHGADLCARFDLGTREEPLGLLARQLRMGDVQATSLEHTSESAPRYAQRPDDSSASGRQLRNWSYDAVLPARSRVAPNRSTDHTRGFPQPVWDIMSCGPRHRFVVRGSDGLPLIVHNCVQAVARDVLAYSMPKAEAAGYEIVLHVHDELVADVPDTDEHSHEGLASIMAGELDWSHGLPLAAAGFTTHRYYKG